MITPEVEETQQDVDRTVFFSFGMFIIDEIEYLPSHPSKPKLTNLPGGAGLYALLGARLLCPPPTSHHLKWLLDAGSDFPSAITSQLNTWATGTRIRVDHSRLTTRAWNGYGHNDTNGSTANESRAFKYLTPKRRLEVDDLLDAWVSSRSWHMVCSAGRCLDIVNEIDARRKSLGLNTNTHRSAGVQIQHDDYNNVNVNDNHSDNSSDNSKDRGIVVWEPIPDLCTPQELAALHAVMQSGKVDVISPNLEELGLYFRDRDGHLPPGMSAEAMVHEAMGWNSHEFGIDSKSKEPRAGDAVCVVREGAGGSTIYFPPSASLSPSPSPSLASSTTTKTPSASIPSAPSQTNTANTSTTPNLRDKPRNFHLPAYHTASTAHLVTDPTGGGNTYLGALACALAYTVPWFLTTSSSLSTVAAASSIRKTEPPPPPVLKAILFTSSHPLLNPFPPIEKALVAAGICACVAASFAIEQSGVPELYVDWNEDGGWEGESWGMGRGRVGERLDGYIARLRGGWGS